MIKSVDHARQVAARRQAKDLRGLPRAVVRFMRAQNSFHEWKLSRADKAIALSLPCNAPL